MAIIEPKSGKPVIKVESPQAVYDTEKKIIRSKQFLWYGWMAIEVLLMIRFLLKLFGANPLSIFNIIINLLTTPFIFIFSGLFPPSVSPGGSMVIEWSTFFAMLVYALIVWVVSVFIRIKRPIDPEEAEEKSEENIP